MKTKVCGLKYSENIMEVASLRPDMMGFIFYKGSKRYVADSLNEGILNAIPISILKVGVFVNEQENIVLDTVKKYHLEMVQLHGNESPRYCETIKKTVPIIKAFGINDLFDFTLCQAYETAVDLFLFDTASIHHGGSGQKFNRSVMQNYNLSLPFLVSGGIDLEEAKTLINKPIHEKCIGIDVNSKFETNDFRKDIGLLKQILH